MDLGFGLARGSIDCRERHEPSGRQGVQDLAVVAAGPTVTPSVTMPQAREVVIGGAAQRSPRDTDGAEQAGVEQ